MMSQIKSGKFGRANSVTHLLPTRNILLLLLRSNIMKKNPASLTVSDDNAVVAYVSGATLY